MVVDIHTHFYPEYVAADTDGWAKPRGEMYWAELVGKRPDGKRSLQGFPSEGKFLSDMDEAGVERAVIQGWYWENPDTCDELNAEIAKLVKRHPDRISAFAAVQPAYGKRAAETAGRARDNGFSGIGELHDGVQKFSYSSADFEMLADVCAEERLPICIHLTERSPRQYLGKVATDFDGATAAARRFGNVDFIFAHWLGGEIFENPENAAELTGRGNVFFDSAASPFLASADAWKTATEKFPSAALYGSDYPLRLYPRKFKTEEMLTIATEASENVPPQFAGNFFETNAGFLLWRKK